MDEFGTSSPLSEHEQIQFMHVQWAREHYQPPLPLQRGQFVEAVWRRFDPRVALQLLADERRSFAGHKEVVFAALGAWLIDPNNPDLVRDAVALAVASELSNAEQQVFSQISSPNLTTFGTSFIELGIQDPYFYEELYYPIGGIRTLLDAPSQEALRATISDGRASLWSSVWMMRIFHYALLHLTDSTRYYPPSINKASGLVWQVAETARLPERPRKRMVKDYWAAHRTNVALAYAASRIRTPDGILLDALMDGSASFKRDEGVIPIWIGQARWICEAVLIPLETGIAEENLRWLPEVPTWDVPDPLLDEQQVHYTEKAFAKKRAA